MSRRSPRCWRRIRAFDFYCYVDSAAQLQNLARHLGRPARPVKLLLEVGAKGGRTGVRTLADALQVADASSPPIRRYSALPALRRSKGCTRPRQGDRPDWRVAELVVAVARPAGKAP